MRLPEPDAVAALCWGSSVLSRSRPLSLGDLGFLWARLCVLLVRGPLTLDAPARPLAAESGVYADEFGVHVDYINSMVLKQVSDDRRLVVVRKVA